MVKFGDYGKDAKDLLGSDWYSYDNKLKVKSKTANGVTFTTEVAISGSTAKAGKISAQFKPVDGITIKKLQATTAGTLLGEASLEGVTDGLKFTVKIQEGKVGGKDNDVGDLTIDYKQSGFEANSKIDVINGPSVTQSLSVNFDSFLVGGSASYNTGVDAPHSAGLTKYSVGAGYTDSDFKAAVNANGKPGKDGAKWGVDVSYFQNFSPEINIAAILGIKDVQAPKPSLDVGFTNKIDSESTVAGKVNTSGVLSFGYSQKINNSITLLTSAQVDGTKFTEDSSDHKLGMFLTFSA